METNRSWRQAGRFEVFDFSGDPVAREKVARAIDALSGERGWMLPELIRRQVVESVLRAVGEQPCPLPVVVTIQVGAPLSGREAPGGAGGLPSSRWGYFLVKRQGERTGEACLLLDLYLYQE